MDKTFATKGKNPIKDMINDATDGMTKLFNENILKFQKPTEEDHEEFRGSSCVRRRTTLDKKFE
jgi:hypothetical protein